MRYLDVVVDYLKAIRHARRSSNPLFLLMLIRSVVRALKGQDENAFKPHRDKLLWLRNQSFGTKESFDEEVARLCQIDINSIELIPLLTFLCYPRTMNRLSSLSQNGGLQPISSPLKLLPGHLIQ